MRELGISNEQDCKTCESAANGADSQHPAVPGEDAVLRSMACGELTVVRDSQRAQLDRYVEFKNYTLNLVSARHQDMMEERKAQNDENAKADAERVSSCHFPLKRTTLSCGSVFILS
jgi:hypothetical protein